MKTLWNRMSTTVRILVGFGIGISIIIGIGLTGLLKPEFNRPNAYNACRDYIQDHNGIAADNATDYGVSLISSGNRHYTFQIGATRCYAVKSGDEIGVATDPRPGQ